MSGDDTLPDTLSGGKKHVVALSGWKDERAPRRMQTCTGCGGTGTTWLMPDGHLVECSECKGRGVRRLSFPSRPGSAKREPLA
jgi:DnaJ-class molecular chaperone